MKVSLSEQEINSLNIIGGLRSLISRATGTKDRKMDDTRKGHEIDLDGVIGEYAYCKANNIFFDPIAYTRSGSYDCLSRKGSRIDIKTTRHLDGNLICTLKVNPDVDIYILAVISGTEVEFVGWIEKEQLVRPENIKDLGKGQGYFMDRKSLKPLN